MTGQLPLEGGIRLSLRQRCGVIQGVEVRSIRPIPANSPFRGYTPTETLRLLPLLYAVCGTAQTVAALRALEVAREIAVAPAQERARDLLVAAETAREHWVTVVREYEHWLGVSPPDEQRARVHRWPERLAAILYPGGDWAEPGGGQLTPDYRVLHALIGEMAGLMAETVASSASGAALMERLGSSRLRPFGAAPLSPLPEISVSQWARWLAADQDAGFRARPVWEGAPCETGPLARQREHPLVAAALARFGAGVGCRQLARLVELAALPARMEALADELTDARPARANGGQQTGSGAGEVEAARGRLVHWVALDEGRIDRHRILAPTEWNFHPEGPLARGLLGATAPDDVGPGEAAEALLRSLDPCVGYTIEVDDA